MNKFLSICLAFVASIGAVETCAQALAQNQSQPIILPIKAKQSVQQIVNKTVNPNEVIVRIKSDSSSSSIADKHPNAVYFILFAAGLAAVASIVTSIITATSSWKLKKREYKNEYYKKIIDKRLKAIEQAEQLVVVFTHTKIRKDGSKYFVFFIKEGAYEEYREIFRSIISHSLWYSANTFKSIQQFNEEVHSVINSSKDLVDLNSKKDILCARYDGIIAKTKNIGSSISKDLLSMDNVEEFFKTRNVQDSLPSNSKDISAKA